MSYTIEAIYENGLLRPIQKLDLPEHKKVQIAILDEDLQLGEIAGLAQQDKAFEFLKNSSEDIYSATDGEGVE